MLKRKKYAALTIILGTLAFVCGQTTSESLGRTVISEYSVGGGEPNT